MLEALSPHLLQITLALCGLVCCVLLTRMLRLPLLAAYLFAGLIAGYLLKIDTHAGSFTFIQQVAFTILIFLVGTELSWQRVRAYIQTSARVSIALIVLSMLGGTLLGHYFGLPAVTSLLLGLCLSCTSGIASVKMLSDEHDTNSLHGRLTISNLFIQDIFAIACLTLIGGFLGRSNLSATNELVLLALRFAAASCILWYISQTVLPWAFKQLKESGELSLLLSLAWCFAGTIGVRLLGIPLEVGALITGLTLAGSPYLLVISARMRPIRDLLMIVLFFIFGANVNGISQHFLLLTVLSIGFMVIARPIITHLALSLQGYRSRASFTTALLQAPMSEYALIFALIGLRANLPHAEALVSIVSAATLASMLTGSIYFAGRKQLIHFFSPLLRHFERGRHRSPELITGGEVNLRNHVVLFGYHRMGFHILRELQLLGKDVVVIDFNPEIINNLRDSGITALYGDVEDESIYLAACISKASVVISTIPMHAETRYLLKTVRSMSPKAAIIVTAKQANQAMLYYHEGADYVLMPHITTSSHLASLIHSYQKTGLKKGLQKLHHERSLEETMKEPLYEG